LSSTAPLRRINKIIPSATEAIQGVKSSSTVLVGGFGFSGVPSTLINAVAARPDIQDLTVVSNNAGMPGMGLGESTSHLYEKASLIKSHNQANYSRRDRSAKWSHPTSARTRPLRRCT
jgi:acyl CoA:acetate/3-ketoacid CoA transferase alpha subunit